MPFWDRFRRNKTVEPSPSEYYFKALETESIVTPERTQAPSSFLMEQYELLYQRDAITFGCINYLTLRIVQDIAFVGSEQDVAKVNKWSVDHLFKQKLEDIVRDVLLYGNAWCEILLGKNDVDIRILNPKYVDYDRDNYGNVRLDEFGEPECIVIQDPAGKYFYITKNKIMKGKEGEVIKSSETMDLRKLFCHFTLFTFGDSYTGLSILLPVMSTAIVRGNVTKMTGELAFRAGGIVAYVSGTMPEEARRKLEEDLSKLTKRSTFISSDKIKLSNIPAGNLTETTNIIATLINEQTAAMGLPYELIMAPVYRGRLEDLSHKLVDFENRILAYQNRLGAQVNKQIMPFVNKVLGTNVTFKFIGTDYSIKLTKSRMLAGLARRGLVTYDKEFENWIRRELGLPLISDKHADSEADSK
jgi:hypothetical protein